MTVEAMRVTGELLQALRRYSLVRLNEGGDGFGLDGYGTFTVHRLLQQVVRDDLGAQRAGMVEVGVRVCIAALGVVHWDEGWSGAMANWYRCHDDTEDNMQSRVGDGQTPKIVCFSPLGGKAAARHSC